MEFENILVAGVIILYSFGALGIFLSTLAGWRTAKKIAHFLTLAGFVLHTVSAAGTFLSEGIAAISASYYLQLLAWCLIFLYLLAWRWLRYPFLGLTAAPLALLLYALSLRFSDKHSLLPEHLAGLFFGLHIWSLYLSIALLAMAFGAGLLFIRTEGKLKKKALPTEFTKDMPSLSTFDKVNSIAVLLGFPLYTLGLMSGFIWTPMAQATMANPKVLLSLLIWFMYALLFYQRAALGYRGRKTAILAIVIFGISALSAGIDYTISHHSMQLLP